MPIWEAPVDVIDDIFNKVYAGEKERQITVSLSPVIEKVSNRKGAVDTF